MNTKMRGFTIAELLIILGIIGVVGAVLLPIVNKFMPDKTKIAYLKVHDELKREIQEIAANSLLYPVCMEEGENSVSCQENPLINTSKPLIKKFENYSGDTKLCKLLAFSMDAKDTCKSGDYTYSDSSFAQSLSFTTKNGMQWKIVPRERTISTDSVSFQTDIYVDVDPSKKSKNCLFSATCKAPDRFKFLVAANGTVIAADPVGQKYLETRKNFSKQKFDFGADASVENILSADLRNFVIGNCTKTLEELCIESGLIWDGATCKEQSAGKEDDSSSKEDESSSKNELYPSSGICKDTGEAAYICHFPDEPPSNWNGDHPSMYNGRIINCIRRVGNNKTSGSWGPIRYTISSLPEASYPVASDITLDDRISIYAEKVQDSAGNIKKLAPCVAGAWSSAGNYGEDICCIGKGILSYIPKGSRTVKPYLLFYIPGARITLSGGVYPLVNEDSVINISRIYNYDYVYSRLSMDADDTYYYIKYGYDAGGDKMMCDTIDDKYMIRESWLKNAYIVHGDGWSPDNKDDMYVKEYDYKNNIR